MDYYQILGVSRTANDTEIRNSFRRIARRHHPDVSGRESDAFMALATKARDTLLDPVKRLEYNKSLEDLVADPFRVSQSDWGTELQPLFNQLSN